MKIQLSDHFSYAKLIRFTLPSVFMMIFISIYGMVDGYFISNIVGKTAFAAVNLIIPFLQIIGGVGAMLGVGGSALVAKTLGEGGYSPCAAIFYHDAVSHACQQPLLHGARHCGFASGFAALRRNGGNASRLH